MKYTFPLLHHIDDIEKFRNDGLIHDAFKKGVRNNQTIVYDYSYLSDDVFPVIGQNPFAAIARELRGITFDAKSGLVLSRPYQKFFNAGEREETLDHRLPLEQSHHVLEKLDGSMIHAFVAPDDTIAFATRWGVTDISAAALNWFMTQAGTSARVEALRAIIEGGSTPVFEWTSPDNVVVVQHSAPALTLTAVRNRSDGAYLDLAGMAGHADALGVTSIKPLPNYSTWESFKDKAYAETSGEGYVVRFDDGHMLKLKNIFYTKIHKFKSNLAMEKDAVAMVLSGKLDDMLPFLLDTENEALKNLGDALLSRISAMAATVENKVAEANANLATDDPKARQKQFWIDYAAPLGGELSGIAVRVWNGQMQAFDACKALVLSETSSGPKYAALAAKFDLPRWSYRFDGDQ